MSIDRGADVACTQPIDAAVLADYWVGRLSQPEETGVEEHLLACDECGTRLREVIALADGVRALARQGSLRMVVSDTFLARAAADGLRVRAYAPPRGGGVQCTVTADDDILVGRLAAPVSEAAQVDLSLCDGQGVEQFRLSDIPVRPGSGGVVYQESMTFAKAAPTTTIVARLLAVDEDGDERLLGEYTFNHTRSLPGPGRST